MDSMRDDLNAALDAADGDYDETEQTVEHDGVMDGAAGGDDDLTVAEVDGEVSEDSGEISEGAGDEGSVERALAKQESDKAAVESEPVQSDDPELTAKDKESIKAPIDWSPKEREDWSRIPRHLQDKIMQREAATSNLMQETAEARRTHADFGGLVQQYGSVLSGVAGDTPMQAVESLFSTVANLRMGSPIQKAQVIADLVNNFGVDINALDTTLSGQMPEQGPNAEMEQRLDQMLKERMAPFTQYEQQMQMQQQQQQQQLQHQAVSEIQTLAESGKAEFFNHVRLEMADLIEVAGKNGRNLTTEQAYNIACSSNPEISEVLEQRKQKQALLNNQNSIGAKQNAASSISGNRSGLNAGNSNLSIRDSIAAAWDD